MTKTGVLYPTPTTNRLRHNLLALGRDRERAGLLGKRARSFVETHFTREQFSRSIVAVYESMRKRNRISAVMRPPMAHLGGVGAQGQFRSAQRERDDERSIARRDSFAGGGNRTRAPALPRQDDWFVTLFECLLVSADQSARYLSYSRERSNTICLASGVMSNPGVHVEPSQTRPWVLRRVS
jgi:hypothetical protein